MKKVYCLLSLNLLITTKLYAESDLKIKENISNKLNIDEKNKLNAGAQFEIRKWESQKNKYLALLFDYDKPIRMLGNPPTDHLNSVVSVYIFDINQDKIINSTKQEVDLIMPECLEEKDNLYSIPDQPKLDLAYYKISDGNIAFGIVSYCEVPLASSTIEYKYLNLFEINNNHVKNIFSTTTSENQEGGLNYYNEYSFVSFSKSKSNGYFNLIKTSKISSYSLGTDEKNPDTYSEVDQKEKKIIQIFSFKDGKYTELKK